LACVVLFALTGALPLRASVWAICLVLLFNGFFRSLQFMSINALAYCEVDSEGMSAATSFAATAQQVAQALGVAGGAAVVEISKALDSDRVAALGDFRAAFFSVAAISAISALAFAKLPRNAGALVARGDLGVWRARRIG
jgi:hypothetical protein